MNFPCGNNIQYVSRYFIMTLTISFISTKKISPAIHYLRYLNDNNILIFQINPINAHIFIVTVSMTDIRSKRII